VKAGQEPFRCAAGRSRLGAEIADPIETGQRSGALSGIVEPALGESHQVVGDVAGF